ncbi:MAG: ribonuclease HII [Gemmatimonadetes bacterium]|nr:ribonuclease HII [Gemmatimonadota bacterium]
MAQRRARWSSIERDLREAGAEHIAGVDEVGRGPLAGPVFACAVIMPAGARAIRGVADSKALPQSERTRLAPLIRARAVAWALGAASVREIEELNILGATTLAMRRALARLRVPPGAIIVDGKPVRGLGVAHHAVVGADVSCYCVAAASILAKVARDGLMRRLAARYPAYAWERNAGYGTAAHCAAIRTAGLTPHHRAAFCAALVTPPAL